MFLFSGSRSTRYAEVRERRAREHAAEILLIWFSSRAFLFSLLFAGCNEMHVFKLWYNSWTTIFLLVECDVCVCLWSVCVTHSTCACASKEDILHIAGARWCCNRGNVEEITCSWRSKRQKKRMKIYIAIAHAAATEPLHSLVHWKTFRFISFGINYFFPSPSLSRVLLFTSAEEGKRCSSPCTIGTKYGVVARECRAAWWWKGRIRNPEIKYRNNNNKLMVELSWMLHSFHLTLRCWCCCVAAALFAGSRRMVNLYRKWRMQKKKQVKKAWSVEQQS